MKNNRWKPEEKELLRKIYPDATPAELESNFDKSYSTVRAYAVRIGLKKSDEYMRRLIARRGYEPRPVGYERICKNGFLWRKVSIERGFVLVHQLVWEEAHGAIPPNHHFNFLDGNRLNVDLANLQLESNVDKVLRISVHNLPEELRDVIRLKSLITKKINGK
ncbi:HNH endonuclease [Paraburkholderia tropica]|uniref:HNH endonuclease signature motif containing protein n=1 Tax=Paraburkholderia tropica TaxID=92647 RepID=UPI0015FFB6DA|nr:HNH endonuclease signature motif containing protein [Paraburkholderia tropica]QNB10893.1 HNH endonuclease [Paraburkholderia tropica]